MLDEPHVYKGNYMQAEVIVQADSEEEAFEHSGKKTVCGISLN